MTSSALQLHLLPAAEGCLGGWKHPRAPTGRPTRSRSPQGPARCRLRPCLLDLTPLCACSRCRMGLKGGVKLKALPCKPPETTLWPVRPGVHAQLCTVFARITGPKEPGIIYPAPGSLKSESQGPQLDPRTLTVADPERTPRNAATQVSPSVGDSTEQRSFPRLRPFLKTLQDNGGT